MNEKRISIWIPVVIGLGLAALLLVASDTAAGSLPPGPAVLDGASTTASRTASTDSGWSSGWFTVTAGSGVTLTHDVGGSVVTHQSIASIPVNDALDLFPVTDLSIEFIGNVKDRSFRQPHVYDSNFSVSPRYDASVCGLASSSWIEDSAVEDCTIFFVDLLNSENLSCEILQIGVFVIQELSGRSFFGQRHWLIILLRRSDPF